MAGQAECTELLPHFSTLMQVWYGNTIFKLRRTYRLPEEEPSLRNPCKARQKALGSLNSWSNTRKWTVFPLLLVRASSHWVALSHTEEEIIENLQGLLDPPCTVQHGWFCSCRNKSTLQEWFLPVFGHLSQKMTLWLPVVVYSFSELKNSSQNFSQPLHLVHADISLFLLS